jgi:ABC-type transporter Mla subunit MlaD
MKKPDNTTDIENVSKKAVDTNFRIDSISDAINTIEAVVDTIDAVVDTIDTTKSVADTSNKVVDTEKKELSKEMNENMDPLCKENIVQDLETSIPSVPKRLDPKTTPGRKTLGMRRPSFKTPIVSNSKKQIPVTPKETPKKRELEVDPQEDIPDSEYNQLRIELLHEYNKFKDLGQMLLGLMAQKQGTTIKDMYAKYDMDLND